MGEIQHANQKKQTARHYQTIIQVSYRRRSHRNAVDGRSLG
jgi:hypothetical protein